MPAIEPFSDDPVILGGLLARCSFGGSRPTRPAGRIRGVSKLERLLNLTAALLDSVRPLTAVEIHQRVPGYPEGAASFHRAFERDKEDLREMGIPIELRPVEGTDPPRDGYLIPKEDYYLPELDLDQDELAALHLALSAVRLDGIQGLEAMWKLGGTPEYEGGLPATALAAIPADDNLVQLFAAVVERRRTSFVYNDEERSVHPYRIDYRKGRWYLTGFDTVRDAVRNFRVDRIRGRVTTAEPGGFTKPEPVPEPELEPWVVGAESEVIAKLIVDRDQALSAVHHVGAEAVSAELPDGSVILTLPVRNRVAFRSFALTFLEHAEVLEPRELRDDLMQWLEDLAR